jgi:hypothetical protein
VTLPITFCDIGIGPPSAMKVGSADVVALGMVNWRTPVKSNT